MNPIAREFKYEDQNGVPNRLTSRQARRARHKMNSRKTHSHDDLLLVVGEDGRERRQPCSRCCTPPRAERRVGGTR